MKQECKYCASRDVGKVIKGLAPDLNKIIETHQIPSTDADVVYNNIHELDEVGIRVNDDFDAIMLSRALRSAMNAGLEATKGTGNSQGVVPVAPQTGNEVSD